MTTYQRKASIRQNQTTSYNSPIWSPCHTAFSLVRRAFRAGKAGGLGATIGATLALLGGCQSYDDAVRADLRQYLHRPARVFFEEKALTVTQVHDRPSGQRVYIAPFRMCGFTVVADLDKVRGEYVTVEITKSC